MARVKFLHFVPRPKPRKRPRRHKKNLNKNEKRSYKKYNRQGRRWETIFMKMVVWYQVYYQNILGKPQVLKHAEIVACIPIEEVSAVYIELWMWKITIYAINGEKDSLLDNGINNP